MPNTTKHFVMEEIYCLPHASYTKKTGRISLSPMQAGPHAVLFFSDAHTFYDGSNDFISQRFAIIVGGIVLDSDGPWVKYVPKILDNDRAEKKFYPLLQSNHTSINSSITKGQLKSLLGEHNAETPIPKEGKLNYNTSLRQ
jgi:hypothetical protein